MSRRNSETPNENQEPSPNEEIPINEEGVERENGEVEEINIHIPENFFYTIEEIVAKPHMPEDSGLPEDLVKLYQSFGCDTLRRDNLHLLDVDIIGFVVGNYFEIHNIITSERSFIRSTSGLGIGAVDIHTEKKYIAIAEKGSKPNVCIYEYPSLKLYRILTEGTQTAYSSCQFSPDGSLLVTVGDEPDYLLTIWDWREEKIVLRNKASTQEVFRVRWSMDLHGILVTAGSGHIRFWRMADTFTGLKLQGSIGKFGKVELSDIEGFLIMPDGKVLSGCEWGNLLLWEGDLIKVQISRKNKAPCHDGLIMQILLYEGELITIGTDGFVRTWEFDAIDQAEAQEEGTLLEMEPMNEIRVSPRAKLMSLKWIERNEEIIWYCLDAQNGIWKLDLSFSHRAVPPQLILPYHAGAIMACAVSPISHIVTTLGSDGTVRVFDIPKKQQVGEKHFSSSGRCLIWLPQEVDPKGKTLIAGFADGVIRVIQITTDAVDENREISKEAVHIELIQVLKPHTSPILSMSIDPKRGLFATSSEDSTIFICRLEGLHVVASGFIRLPIKAFKIQWHRTDAGANPTLLLLMERSYVLEVSIPVREAPERGTFEIIDVKPLRGFQMDSVAGALRVAESSAQKRLAYKEAKRRRDENILKLFKEGHIKEEDLAKADEDEKRLQGKLEDELARLKVIVPEIPSPVIGGFICHEDPNLIWINLGDCDAGYMYKCGLMDLADPISKTSEELEVESKEGRILTELETVLPRVRSTKPLQSACIIDCNDSPLISWTFSHNGNRVIMGFENGLLRIQMLQNPFDFSEMGPFWTYAFSDNNRGALKGLDLTFDESFIVTAGADGTLFALEFMSEDQQRLEVNEMLSRLPSSSHEPVVQDDIQDPSEFSIEQARRKMEWDKLVEAGEEKKRETRRQVAELKLRFKMAKEMNERLPVHMRISSGQYEILDQLRDKLLNEREEQMDILNKEAAFESRRKSIALQKLIDRFRKDLSCEYIILRAFGTSDKVSTIRKNKLPEQHMELMKHLKEAVNEENAIEADRRKTKYSVRTQHRQTEHSQLYSSDLISRSKVKGARGLRYVRELQAIEAKRQKREKRRQQWVELYALKPSNTWEDPLDIAAINQVKNNMGDYKLKSSSNYAVSDEHKTTGLKSRLTLLEAIEQISERQDDFNHRLLKLRDKKAFIIKELKKINENLKQISDDLPPNEVTFRLKVEELDDFEFPERAFDATEAALEAFKNSFKASEKVNDEQAKQMDSNDDDDETKAEKIPDFTVFLFNNRPGIFIPMALLLKPKCFFTLNLHVPNQPNILGLPLYVNDPEDVTVDENIQMLETHQPHKPETMVDSTDTGNVNPDMHASPVLFQRTQSADLEDNLRLEMKKQELRYAKALYKQKCLIAEAGKMVRCFNMELRTLSHQKVNLDYLMKRANLNVLILYEEYKLLSEFESEERGLTDNYDNKLQEKNDIEEKIADNEVEIESTLANIERTTAKENEVYEDFKAFLGESNSWSDFLQKVYRKKVKRKAKGANAGENASEESSVSDSFTSEISEWNDSDEYKDSEEDYDIGEGESGTGIYDLDTCPPGCPETDYDQTVAFREMRLDVEDEITEQKHLLETIKKESEILAKKAKIAQQNLQQATVELQEFQLEKQRKLNIIERMVNLRLDQINYFLNGSLPSDFDQVLVFRNDSAEQLRNRIQSLDEEKPLLRNEKHQAKEKYKMFQRHKKVFQGELQKMVIKCDAMMIDKFGRLEDLERLETIHPKAEELTLRTLGLQARIQREEKELEEKLRNARDEYIVQLRENTRLVMKKLMLFNEMQTLSKALDKHLRNPKRGSDGSQNARTEDLNTRLKAVYMQAEEINKLTAEYRYLSEQEPKTSNSHQESLNKQIVT
ncbi:unnamed protein product [Rodentolepis nana]|uniref:Cilia- and flagella-associated protein 44 n=1 Tax=Rodentolepis nana TaxID=102285 RepID=A0A0R3T022_RODNA|nr:unnamed protein product [Rodentolepis nana]